MIFQHVQTERPSFYTTLFDYCDGVQAAFQSSGFDSTWGYVIKRSVASPIRETFQERAYLWKASPMLFRERDLWISCEGFVRGTGSG